jgi:membrane protease YdiL (CAAX protease family)
MKSLALLTATPRQAKVPLGYLVLAICVLGNLAIALVDKVVGVWYVLALLSTVGLSGPNFERLKLGLPKKKVMLVAAILVAPLMALALCLIGAALLTTMFPMGTVELLDLLLPLATADAIGIWSFGIPLLGMLFSAVLLILYLFYIALNEEAVFRGSLLTLVDGYFSGAYGILGKFGAIVGMACAFALFHFVAGALPFAWGSFLILVWLGIVWGITSLVTRSIWPTVIAHAAWNGIAFLQRGLILQAIAIVQSPQFWSLLGPTTVVMAVGGIPVLALLFWWTRTHSAGFPATVGLKSQVKKDG